MTRPTAEVQGPGAATQAVNAQHVAEFLREHPDFFEQHPELLLDLRLPHRSGSAVSLVERQVSILRDRNIEMRRRLSDLLGNARDNDQLFNRTRALILDALDAKTPDALFTVVKRHLHEEFAVEHVSLLLFAGTHSGELPVVDIERAQQEIGHLLRANQAVLGVLRDNEVRFLFGDVAPAPKSAAVVPLRSADLLGVLAMGSADAARFGNNMGTLFVRHLGDVIAKLVLRTLDVPSPG